jgi:mono/diheme cytochrome c family protein
MALAALGLVALAAVSIWWVGRAQAGLAEGARVYAADCASCHGARLEGQPNWWRPGPDGMLPAPPHDASGHTWQHTDAELYDLIAHSVVNVAPKSYRTAMPAYAGTLGPADIRAVIDFIKSQWPPGVRAYQASLNAGKPDYASLGPDWVFPPTCLPHSRAGGG